MTGPSIVNEVFDAVVVGGGPAGATIATELAEAGRKVLLLDRAGRIKPCGGAVPPRLIHDYQIPDHLLVARVTSARMVSPSDRRVDMPIENGFVGMVDRATFDEWLRERAAAAGAVRRTGTYKRIERDAGGPMVVYEARANGCRTGEEAVRTRLVIGADGARSNVARQEVPGGDKIPYVIAYHEIVRSPETDAAREADFDPCRCDVYYKGELSPDFYGWVFPHGSCTSVGMGTAQNGFSLREATARLREYAGLSEVETVREEGAPIPLKPLKRWDNGRDVLLAGDAAGTVAPASGEGIYYAMCSGSHVAEAAGVFLETGNAKALRLARKRFMKAHGRVFFVLGLLQYFWYKSDRRREGFVSICRDPDVQKLTWDAYMNKRLVRRKPMAHIRIFFKDVAQLTRLVSP